MDIHKFLWLEYSFYKKYEKFNLLISIKIKIGLIQCSISPYVM